MYFDNYTNIERIFFSPQTKILKMSFLRYKIFKFIKLIFFKTIKNNIQKRKEKAENVSE